MAYVGPLTSTEEFHERGMKYESPPHGRGGRSIMRYKFDFVEWAQNPENIAAWKEIAAKHKLRESEWKDVGSIFGRANFCLHRPYPSVLRYVDSRKHELGNTDLRIQCHESENVWLLWLCGFI